MQFSVHGLWRWRGRGGFYFSTSFFPSWNLFLPSPLQAAHIQRWAIIPVDLPCSSNGVRVSEGFSLCISQSHVAGRLSREEVRSQLPGDRTATGMAVIYFATEQSQSKANVGRKNSPPPPPVSSRAAILLSSGRLWEGWWWWRGKGEGGWIWKERRQISEVKWVRFLLQPSSDHSGFLQHPSQLYWIHFSCPTNTEVLEMKHWSCPPSWLAMSLWKLLHECLVYTMKMGFGLLGPISNLSTNFCKVGPSPGTLYHFIWLEAFTPTSFSLHVYRNLPNNIIGLLAK